MGHFRGLFSLFLLVGVFSGVSVARAEEAPEAAQAKEEAAKHQRWRQAAPVITEQEEPAGHKLTPTEKFLEGVFASLREMREVGLEIKLEGDTVSELWTSLRSQVAKMYALSRLIDFSGKPSVTDVANKAGSGELSAKQTVEQMRQAFEENLKNLPEAQRKAVWRLFMHLQNTSEKVARDFFPGLTQVPDLKGEQLMQFAAKNFNLVSAEQYSDLIGVCLTCGLPPLAVQTGKADAVATHKDFLERIRIRLEKLDDLPTLNGLGLVAGTEKLAHTERQIIEGAKEKLKQYADLVGPEGKDYLALNEQQQAAFWAKHESEKKLSADEAKELKSYLNMLRDLKPAELEASSYKLFRKVLEKNGLAGMIVSKKEASKEGIINKLGTGLEDLSNYLIGK